MCGRNSPCIARTVEWLFGIAVCIGSFLVGWKLDVLDGLGLPWSDPDYDFFTGWMGGWGIILGIAAIICRTVFLEIARTDLEDRCSREGVAVILLGYVYHLYRWPTLIAFAATGSSSLVVLSFWLDWLVAVFVAILVGLGYAAHMLHEECLD